MNSHTSKLLLEWHKTNRKDYPFRNTNDPYRILICEILLRQTTGEQVASIYHQFFNRFPSILGLASARPSQILEVIRPLGMHGRADDLSQVSRAVVGRFDSTIPNSFEDLTSLRGVGRYVANCVLAFAYGKEVPLVDTNAERFLCRILGMQQGKGAPREEVWSAYSRIASTKNIRGFHYALIDFSHKICRQHKPKCDICPLNNSCKTLRRRQT